LEFELVLLACNILHLDRTAGIRDSRRSLSTPLRFRTPGAPGVFGSL